jgi:hypothetical protein
MNGLPDDDDFQDFTDEFFIIITRMISFINHSCQFYIFTLSSKLFRQELKRTFQQLRIAPHPHPAMMVTIHNNQIHLK